MHRIQLQHQSTTQCKVITYVDKIIWARVAEIILNNLARNSGKEISLRTFI